MPASVVVDALARVQVELDVGAAALGLLTLGLTAYVLIRQWAPGDLIWELGHQITVVGYGTHSAILVPITFHNAGSQYIVLTVARATADGIRLRWGGIHHMTTAHAAGVKQMDDGSLEATWFSRDSVERDSAPIPIIVPGGVGQTRILEFLLDRNEGFTEQQQLDLDVRLEVRASAHPPRKSRVRERGSQKAYRHPELARYAAGVRGTPHAALEFHEMGFGVQAPPTVSE